MAERNIALMLAQGEGTAKDLVEAYKWFKIAAADGQQYAAEEMTSTAARMSKADIAEAEKRASAWSPKFEWVP